MLFIFVYWESLPLLGRLLGADLPGPCCARLRSRTSTRTNTRSRLYVYWELIPLPGLVTSLGVATSTSYTGSRLSQDLVIFRYVYRESLPLPSITGADLARTLLFIYVYWESLPLPPILGADLPGPVYWELTPLPGP